MFTCGLSYHTAALVNQVPPGEHDAAPTFLWKLTFDSAQLEFPGNLKKKQKKHTDRTSFMVLCYNFKVSDIHLRTEIQYLNCCGIPEIFSEGIMFQLLQCRFPTTTFQR